MLKIFRVSQSLRNVATFPGGLQLCKKIPTRCDFIVEITDDVAQANTVLSLLNVISDNHSTHKHILIRFFRNESTHTVDSATVSCFLNGVCKYFLVADIVKLRELCENIEQGTGKNANGVFNEA